jgi:putative membrane protein
MLVNNNGSMTRILLWQWRSVVLYLALAAVAFVVHDVLGWKHTVVPSAGPAVLGSALGIFASFRTSAAYARWWEGRQLWGRLVNGSRLFVSQLTAYVPDSVVVRTVVNRHVLYVHVLRCQLRDDDPFTDPHVLRLLPRLGVDEAWIATAKQQTSLLHWLAHESLQALARTNVDPLRLQSLEGTVASFLDVQGGCERIKRTPMPRGYGFFVSRLLFLFAALFPFTLVKDLGWVVLPLNLVVCLGFQLISETGRILEDPFNHFFNSLPITNLSVVIERNLRQRLGDDDLPAAIVPDDKGVLW